MSLIHKLTIEGPPLSVNQTYVTGKHRGQGRSVFFLTPKAKTYMDSCRWQAKMQRPQQIITQEIEVTYRYYFKDKRIHDHMNYNKALNDSLEQIVWKNDNQIKNSHHYTKYDKINPRVEIEIHTLSESSDA